MAHQLLWDAWPQLCGWLLVGAEALLVRFAPRSVAAVAEGVSASFLSRPPHYHLEGQQAGQGGGASAELVVDCSEQMLKQILEEDTNIRLAYEALVSTGMLLLLLLHLMCLPLVLGVQSAYTPHCFISCNGNVGHYCKHVEYFFVSL